VADGHISIVLAEAVKEAINNASFDYGTVEAIREYAPELRRDEMGTDLHVFVVPSDLEKKLLSRTSTNNDVNIDIGVFIAPDKLDNATLDPIMSMIQEIDDLFVKSRSIPGYAGQAPWVRSQSLPIFDPDDMNDKRQLSSLLRMTFKVCR